jgi:hypothetical protein
MEDRVILHFKRAENVYLTDKSEGYEGFSTKLVLYGGNLGG